MIAMELNGAHVGSVVTLMWVRRKANQMPTPKKPLDIKVSEIKHWSNGDVSLTRGNYYKDPKRYPPDASVLKVVSKVSVEVVID